MKRRTLLVSCAALLVSGGPLLADEFSERIMRRLRRQGYTGIAASRTLLGRSRIVGFREGGKREIVLNPNTGEILRDLWVRGEMPPRATSTEGRGGQGGTGTGSGTGGDDDSDDDSDDSGSDDSGSDDSGGDDGGGDGGGDGHGGGDGD